jgi:D-alanyl-D-alanine carboxypeptidase
MAKAAKAAGATHSTFYDVSGMNSKNKTTALDMAYIGLAAFRNRTIQQAASKMEYRFSVLDPKLGNYEKSIKNTNDLLTKDPDLYVVGGKTGYLEESQYNLVVQMRPFDGQGNPVREKELMVVVLGAPTKEGSFAAAKRLAEWAWDNHEFGTAHIATTRTK